MPVVLAGLGAIASVVVPYCLGSVVGAIASGRVRAGAAADAWSSWLNPTSATTGLLAVAVCAYLAAVYLAFDAHRLGQPDMVTCFRRRALVAGVVADALSGAGIFVLAADAPELFEELTTRGLTLVLVSGATGVVAALVILPALGFLFVLHQRSRLGTDEGDT